MQIWLDADTVSGDRSERRRAFSKPEHKKNRFLNACLKIVVKAELNFGFWTMQRQFGGCIFGPPYRGADAIPSRAVTSCWLPIRVYLFVFVFACLGPIYLIGGFHHQCCGQNQNWSKHELGCRANPGSSSLSWENGNPAVRDRDVSNFGLPRCQIFDCFSISPLSRLLFWFLHSNLDCCGVLFLLCNKIRFPEVSYLKKLFWIAFCLLVLFRPNVFLWKNN